MLGLVTQQSVRLVAPGDPAVVKRRLRHFCHLDTRFRRLVTNLLARGEMDGMLGRGLLDDVPACSSQLLS